MNKEFPELPETCEKCQYLYRGYARIGGAIYSCRKGLGVLSNSSVFRKREVLCPLTTERIIGRKEAGKGDEYD